MTVRLHDGDGRTIAEVNHNFVMPEMTGDDDTYYTVRKGDCLWIIARNFLRRGVLFNWRHCVNLWRAAIQTENCCGPQLHNLKNYSAN